MLNPYKGLVKANFLLVCNSIGKVIDISCHGTNLEKRATHRVAPAAVNRSLRDKTYERKLDKYSQQNLLTASLHKTTYSNNPAFNQFIKRSGLPFKPHDHFKMDDVADRQGLYRQICEQIWDPRRLNQI